MGGFRFTPAADNSSRVLHVNSSGGLTLLDYSNGRYHTKDETNTTHTVAACWAMASSVVLTVEISEKVRFLRLWESSKSDDPNEWTMCAECTCELSEFENLGGILLPRESQNSELGPRHDSQMVAWLVPQRSSVQIIQIATSTERAFSLSVVQSLELDVTSTPAWSKHVLWLDVESSSGGAHLATTSGCKISLWMRESGTLSISAELCFDADSSMNDGDFSTCVADVCMHDGVLIVLRQGWGHNSGGVYAVENAGVGAFLSIVAMIPWDSHEILTTISSMDERQLIVCTDFGRVATLDWKTGSWLNDISDVATSPLAKQLHSSNDTGKVRSAFASEVDRLIFQTLGSQSQGRVSVSELTVKHRSKDSKPYLHCDLLITSASNGTFHACDFTTRKCLTFAAAHFTGVSALSWIYEGSLFPRSTANVDNPLVPVLATAGDQNVFIYAPNAQAALGIRPMFALPLPSSVSLVITSVQRLQSATPLPRICVTALVCSPGGRYLACGDKYGDLRVFRFSSSAEAGPESANLEAHTRTSKAFELSTEAIETLSWSDDEAYVVVGHAGGSVVVALKNRGFGGGVLMQGPWDSLPSRSCSGLGDDSEKNHVVAMAVKPACTLSSCILREKGLHCFLTLRKIKGVVSTNVAAQQNRTAWIPTSNPPEKQYKLDSPCVGAVVHPSKESILALSVSGTVCIYEIWSGELHGVFSMMPTMSQMPSPVLRYFMVDPSGLYIGLVSTLGAQSTIIIHQVLTGKHEVSIPLPASIGLPTSAAWSPCGNYLALGTSRTCKIIELPSTLRQNIHDFCAGILSEDPSYWKTRPLYISPFPKSAQELKSELLSAGGP